MLRAFWRKQHLCCDLWRRQWHSTPVLLPGKSHGRRSLVGCSPWGHEESDTTERLHFHFSLSCIREGNGNPLQCSHLEIPGTGEPGGLPSMGSHRVGHDWSDLAAAAAVTCHLTGVCSFLTSITWTLGFNSDLWSCQLWNIPTLDRLRSYPWVFSDLSHTSLLTPFLIAAYSFQFQCLHGELDFNVNKSLLQYHKSQVKLCKVLTEQVSRLWPGIQLRRWNWLGHTAGELQTLLSSVCQ